jgi:hypothetical protein
MKKYLSTLIFLVAVAISYGQTVVPSGSPGQVTDFKGGIKAQKSLGLPNTNTDTFPPQQGNVRFNPDSHRMEVYSGTTWAALPMEDDFPEDLQDILQSGDSAAASIRLTHGNGLYLHGETLGDSVGLKYNGGLKVTSSTDAFTFNDRNVVRSIDNVTADSTGNIDYSKFEKKDLPRDFFVSCTYSPDPVEGRFMLYKTDTFRKLDLHSIVNDLVPVQYLGVYATYNIQRDLEKPNDLFIVIQLKKHDGTLSNRAILALYDCNIIDNELKVGSSNLKIIDGLLALTTGAPAHLQGAVYKNGFLFYSTRPNNDTIPTQIVRINAYDLNDVKILGLPSSAGYFGYSTCMDYNGEWLYLLMRPINVLPRLGYVIKIHQNLDNYDILFSYGTDSKKAIVPGNYFIIKDDEIIIPTSNNESYPVGYSSQVIGLSIFNMTGTLKREVDGLVINTDSQFSGRPSPNWMTIFNNKAIISYTNTSSGLSPLKMVRIDIGQGYDNSSIILEESYWNYGQDNFTNDNSITSNGYLYMNHEGTYDYLYKIKYNDFSDYIEERNEYYSLGTINPSVSKQSLKTNLSQFKNDGDGTTPFLTIADISAITPDATPANKGKAKLYTNVDESNTDGAPDQNSVKTALNQKMSRLGTTINPGETFSVHTNSGTIQNSSIVINEEFINFTTPNFNYNVHNLNLNGVHTQLGNPLIAETVTSNAPITYAANYTLSSELDVPSRGYVDTKINTLSQLTICSTTPSITHTGTINQTILKTYTIPANTWSNGIINLTSVYEAINVSSGAHIQVYISPNPEFNGTGRIGLSYSTINKWMKLSREIILYNSNLYMPASGQDNVQTEALETETIPFDPTVTNYVVVTAILENPENAVTLRSFELTFKKSQ